MGGNKPGVVVELLPHAQSKSTVEEHYTFRGPRVPAVSPNNDGGMLYHEMVKRFGDEMTILEGPS